MDLNSDGHKDVLSGSYNPGDFYLFAGSADGNFKAAQILQGQDGKNLNAGLASVVFAADWDEDGDLDLIVGNIKGEVHWIANVSKTKTPVFGSPVPIEVDGKPIVVGRDAGPCVVDWDGDGKPDLLVGDDEGAVTFYRNSGSAGCQLATAVVLVAKSKIECLEDGRGGRSKICVADWNGDERLDLLLGDFGLTHGIEPEMTEAQRAEQDAAQIAKKEIIEKIDSFTGLENDEDHQALQKELAAQEQILQKYKAPLHFHGRVWVFLRQPAGAAVMEADAQRSKQ